MAPHAEATRRRVLQQGLSLESREGVKPSMRSQGNPDKRPSHYLAITKGGDTSISTASNGAFGPTFGPTSRVLHGVIFDALEGVPDELAALAEAVRGALEARGAFAE